MPTYVCVCVCAMKDPDTEKVMFFELHALPFGASAAVHNFNRASMALEHIFASVFGIPCTHYFDDFTFIGPDNMMPSLMEIAKYASAFLGWMVKVGDKEKPLADVFKALGVSFDLKETSTPAPILRVVNTASRIENIISSIEEILSSGDITTQQASRLAGKLVFARSEVF